ncbi:radical SAM protein [Streptomyces sp. NBC_01304]|uniref:radical SAM protein n=1 Tax=Streptomyces sp. NBC_01304 TaxID=2903818 RepID=UPI002E0E5084|nr:radical SAM protein [Streptomyces sp. NBC_01304]
MAFLPRSRSLRSVSLSALSRRSAFRRPGPEESPGTAAAAALPPAGAGFVHSVLLDARDDQRGTLMSVRLAGDPVRCPYGAHPETWFRGGAQRLTAADLLMYALVHLPALQAGQGLELSGGEPLAQPEFTASVLAAFKQAGVRTRVRTSGHAASALSPSVLDAADEVVLDLHAADERTSWALHHRRAEPALAFARRAAEHGVPLRMSYLLVPGVTDSPEAVASAAHLGAELDCPVELRPYAPVRRDVFQQLHLDPPRTAKAPGHAALGEARERFARAGARVAVAA